MDLQFLHNLFIANRLTLNVLKTEFMLAGSRQRKAVFFIFLGHALGFLHEQSRPDRDKYVEIKFENIRPGRYFDQNKFYQLFTTNKGYTESAKKGCFYLEAPAFNKLPSFSFL